MEGPFMLHCKISYLKRQFAYMRFFFLLSFFFVKSDGKMAKEMVFDESIALFVLASSELDKRISSLNTSMQIDLYIHGHHHSMTYTVLF